MLNCSLPLPASTNGQDKLHLWTDIEQVSQESCIIEYMLGQVSQDMLHLWVPLKFGVLDFAVTFQYVVRISQLEQEYSSQARCIHRYVYAVLSVLLKSRCTVCRFESRGEYIVDI